MTAQLEQLYQAVILDHAKHPRCAGLREPYDGESRQVNPTCGDEITLRVRLAADGTVADVSYDALGCSISQASASVLSELAAGRAVRDLAEVGERFRAMLHSRGADAGDADVLGDGVAFAGVSRYPARVKCAMLPWAALSGALVAATDQMSTEGDRQ